MGESCPCMLPREVGCKSGAAHGAWRGCAMDKSCLCTLPKAGGCKLGTAQSKGAVQ